ncbi:MAG: ribonuclease III [Dongiaceae bacterium]
MSEAEPGAAHPLETALGHAFADPGLLIQALTHPSIGRGGPAGGYERLEFLGDRVLGLVVADLLYRGFPDATEGALARRFAQLVRRESLARVAAAIDLAPHIRLSRGEAESGGRDNAGLLADCCEAVIGALWLDGGLEAAAPLIQRFWVPMIAEAATPPQDARTALQDWAQARALPLPSYRTVGESGPPHDPTFVVAVAVEGQPPAEGTARSKRAAATAAAAAMLARLGLAHD